MNERDPDCICYGNWRDILKECRADIGRMFVDGRTGDEYLFFGVVDGDDDYYYGMWREGCMQLLSCVGSIETYGFTKVTTKQ